MADLDMELIGPVEVDSELLNRPDKTFLITGQAGFLAVALHLQIPILSSGKNIAVMMSPSASGAGASFAVSNFIDEFTAAPDVDFVNEPPVNWFRQPTTERRSVSLRYVLKRIITAPDPRMDDPRQLASIVNEMRVLSNRTLRTSRNIVSLLGISWYERPSHGRYWPQLLIESAEFGTLENFVSSKQRNFQTKVMLGLDIIDGLNFLHIHGIVHCDLKPSNVLVFADSTFGAADIDINRLGIDPVAAKICDFGCSVILSDYHTDRPFQARIGTFPWMSPELELSLPIEVSLLHKTDIFSFGLLMASIFMNGCKPYQNMNPEEVTAIKLDETSGWQSVLGGVKATDTLSHLEDPFVSMVLLQTLLPNPDHRFDLESIAGYLKLALMLAISTREAEGISNEEEQSPLSGTEARNMRAISSNSPLEEPTQTLSWGGSLRSIFQNFVSHARDLYRRNSGRQNRGSLSEAFFGRRFIQPDPLPRIQVPISPRAGLDTPRDVDVHRLDDEGYITDSNAVSTVPDLCFEYGFRPGLLPAVTTQEVFEDLRKQAADSEHCNSEVLYALAGGYVNETIVDGDLDLGLHFLAKAADRGNYGAITVLCNVFDSCDRILPDSLVEAIRQKITDTAPDCIMLLVPDVRALKVPWKVSQNHSRGEEWRRQFPDNYNAFVQSDLRRSRQALLISIINSSLDSVIASDQRNTPFDFSSLQCWQQRRGYLWSSELNIDAFVEEVKELHCVDRPNGWGLTLLQQAVAYQDYAMIVILIDRLGADVNFFGNTPGWTPFWLCCLFGQFDIAITLLTKGASIDCQDQETGATILHMINQFADDHHIEAVLNLALSDNSCLDVERASTSGMTPLHATFAGWDFSTGAAARALLKLGANPTASAPDNKDFITPIGLCMLRLDAPLLECMLQCPWITERMRDADALKAIAVAKAQAFRSLVGKTQFYFRAVVGKDWSNALRSVLQLIVDEEMIREFDRSPLVDPEAGLLRVVVNTSRTYMAKALMTPSPLLEATQNVSNRRPILHLAIERRLRGCVHLLIRLGANILEKDRDEQTALHAAAHYFPAILAELIDVVERMEPEQRGGMSTKQILETHNVRGFDIIGLLIVEGYVDEIRMAEVLRVKYELDLDLMHPMTGYDLVMTLTGAMICASVVHGLVPTEQFEYLLGLSPRPKFVCSRSGNTLLEFAVYGFMSHHHSLDIPNHQLVKMILQRYPERQNLLIGPERVGAICKAAQFANHTAIRMMQNHIQALNRQNPLQAAPFHRLVNSLTKGGQTVLDYASNTFYNSTSDTSQFSQLQKVRHKDGLICYKYLRTHGALHSFELKGVFMRSRMLYSRLISPETWGHFINNAIRRLNISENTHELPPLIMTHNESDPEIIRAIEANPSLAGKVCKMRIIELVWLFDSFCFRTYEFVFSPFKVKEHMEALMEHVSRDIGWSRCYRALDPDDEPWPWLRTTYKQFVPMAEENITWTRPGRTWTREETDELCDLFAILWAESFGPIEQSFIEHGFPILAQNA